jgi:hypothetical protein
MITHIITNELYLCNAFLIEVERCDLLNQLCHRFLFVSIEPTSPYDIVSPFHLRASFHLA